MTAPDPDVLIVAVEALRSDARLWDGASDEVAAAAGSARALTLDASVFSFAGHEVAAVYMQLQERLVSLLDGGTAALDGVAANLRASADAYEAEERANVHMLRGIW